MAADLVWLVQAETDLQSIFEYISIENASAAKLYVEAILSACDRLRDFPLSGRRFDNRYRVLVVRNHLVMYRHQGTDGEVIVAAIIDGRRDIAALLRTLTDEQA